MAAGLSTRHWVLVAVMLVSAVVVFGGFGPIAQDPSYHNFADKEEIWGIPNGLNVLSNAAFFFAALMGLEVLINKKAVFRHESERIGYFVLFCGLFFTGAGSAYYHWAPTHETLVWDRLPMTITFMSIVSIVIAEQVNMHVGMRLLVPLVFLGIVSVSWWAITELHPDYVGDLRLYVLVQLAPVILTPLMVILFEASYSHNSIMVLVAIFYIVSKMAEFWDHWVYTVSGKYLSGHSLKHFLAAAGCAWIPFMIKKRKIVKTE